MAKRTSKQRGLGRGLSALMADVNETTGVDSGDQKSAERLIPIEKIAPNPDQPRRSFDKEKLDDLAASVKEKGIIQPLIVREKATGNADFEIVAGERRWRAAQMANIHQIPVIVREFNDVEVLEIAIIENIQRADLNPIEEAAGFNQLMNKFGHTQEKLAEVLGKSRSHIANSVRLLQLPSEVRAFLEQGELSAGHARALITSDDPVALAKKVVKGGLSVRETEKLAKSGTGENFAGVKPKSTSTGPAKDADTRALEGDISANLGMKVTLSHKPGAEKGQMVISYDSFDQLDELCRILSS